MRNIVILFFVTLTACNSKNNLELEVLTKQINCKKVTLNEYSNYVKFDTVAVADSRTIISYKLTNNSDETYYFNLDDYNDTFRSRYIRIDRGFLAIYDKDGKYQSPHIAIPSGGIERNRIYYEYLGYQYRGRLHDTNRNFLIHPNETLYFEWFLVLPFGNMEEYVNYSVVLNQNKTYFAELLLHSDTVNIKKSLSRTDLKTIQDNGYKIFNGTIKSKNKVPIALK